MTKIKRFILFAGQFNYPTGGWDDFRSSYDTFEDADLEGKTIGKGYEWYHVVDRDGNEDQLEPE